MTTNILNLTCCQIDLERRRIVRAGETVRLTSREVALLRYLADRPNSVVSREELLQEVWGYAVTVVSRAVDKTVARLRIKIERDGTDPDHLLTEYGHGFRLVLSAAGESTTAPEPKPESRPEPEHPAPPATAPGISGLPTEHDAFIGRVGVLKTLHQLLSREARLISVLGSGGAGKTRLVLHYARQQHTQWPGGIWFCDLSEVRTLSGLLSVVGRTLRVPLGKGEPIDQLGHVIAGRGRCLVILDNFEQLVAHAAVVSRWLALTTDARFVVTTRHRLELAEESVLSIPSLSPMDSAALFIARARSVAPRFIPDQDARTAIDCMVARLDHLPLAIELAAARVRIMSPTRLLARMDDRFRLLVSSKSRPKRQMTLRTMLDWSWELLSEWEQAALAQLSVFEGGFDLDAAESVIDLGAAPGAPWEVDVLQSLVDKSLLRTATPDRFSMLVSVQAYAAEKLVAQGGTQDAESRHGVYYAALSTTEVPSILEWARTSMPLPSLVLEHRNLMRACERALARNDQTVAVDTVVAVWTVLERSGPFEVGDRLARAILEMESEGERRPLQQAQVHYIAGQASRLRGRLQDAQDHYQRSLERYQAAQQPQAQAMIMAALGNLYRQRRQFDDAQQRFEQALAMHRAEGDRHSEGRTLSNLGILYAQTGRFEPALDCMEESLAILDALGSLQAKSISQINLGNLYRSQGRFAEALRIFTSALETCRALDNHYGQGFVLGCLGNLYREQGNDEQAGAHYIQAADIYRSVGDRALAALSVENLGLLRQDQQRLEEARALFEEALRLNRSVGDAMTTTRTLRYLGEVMLRLREPHTARTFFSEALTTAPADASRMVGAILTALALIAVNRGMHEEARSLLEQSLPLLADGRDVFVAQSTARHAEIWFRLGELENARECLRAAEALSGPHRSRHEEVRSALQAAQDRLYGNRQQDETA